MILEYTMFVDANFSIFIESKIYRKEEFVMKSVGHRS